MFSSITITVRRQSDDAQYYDVTSLLTHGQVSVTVEQVVDMDTITRHRVVDHWMTLGSQAAEAVASVLPPEFTIREQ